MKTCLNLKLAVVVSVFLVVGFLSFFLGLTAPPFIIALGLTAGFGLGYFESRLCAMATHFAVIFLGFLFGTLQNPSMNVREWLIYYLLSSVAFWLSILWGALESADERYKKAMKKADEG